MSLLLKNVRFLDWQNLTLKDTNIVVEEGQDGSISFVGKPLENEKYNEVLDCEGRIVTKSFAVGHHHVYSALATGMPAPKKNPKNFYEILKYVWWTLDKALDKEMIEASALSTAVSCARAGATFVIDHHASPNAINGSLEIIAQAFDKVGVGHLLCYEITDRDGTAKAQKGLDETENYLQNNQGLVGLHASFTVGNETLRKAADLVEKYQSGIHIHVAEDPYDQEVTMTHYGVRVLERLQAMGLLDYSKTILAHGLHLSEQEKKLFFNAKAFLVENMESNLNNGVGFFNGTGLGSRIMLGTDGMHSDMIRSAQHAFFVGKNFESLDVREVYTRFRNVHRYLSENNFEGDGENNLVIFDDKYDTPVTNYNVLGHFIYGWNASNIQHVISDGKIIIKNKILQTCDEKEITGFAHEQAKRLWDKLN